MQPVFHDPDYPAGCMPIDYVHDAQVPRTFIGALVVSGLSYPFHVALQAVGAPK